MATYRTCDGLRRRDVLTAGALTGLGLGLSGFLRRAAAGEAATARAKSVIFVYLGGGPTHMDTFDMKPNAPDEYRGEFKPIATNAPGVEFSELLPKLALCADKFAVLRGVSHTLAAHNLGTLYLHTGNRPIPSLEFPGYGSVISKELASPPDLPPSVAIPNTPQKAGYLGVRYATLQTNAAPRFGQPFTVRGMSLGRGLTVSDVERRQQLLQDVDTAFRGVEMKSELLDGLDEFSHQAHQIISSKKAREAFDVAREPKEVAARFGEHDFGQSCLLATRLVEAGVRFVTVTYGGWDTHQDNFNKMKTTQLPKLDDGLAALFATLAERGLLDSTLVLVCGEFGRTPKINQRAGRDHWARAMFALLGGGGVLGGQVLGSSDDKGMGPAGDPITPDQIAASVYQALGIDYTKEYETSTGRPVMIVRNGAKLPGLFG